jgi:hypothetical protein
MVDRLRASDVLGGYAAGIALLSMLYVALEARPLYTPRASARQ